MNYPRAFDTDGKASEDAFYRHSFARRLAHTILDQPPGECLIVSISSEWGAGKTNVLEWMKEVWKAPNDSQNHGKFVRIADFNPWGISGERDLLFRLYEQIVKTVFPKGRLLTRWQSIKLNAKKHITPAGKVAASLAKASQQSYAGAAIDGATSLFETICHVGIAEVRANVEQKLKSFNGRIVVVIDDIDRLERDELLTLLRILKRDAALPNSTYLLAMDEVQVARVIGGDEDTEEKGLKYLEKIIQVRLQLPEIPPHIMKSFVIRHLEDAIFGVAKLDRGRFDQVFDPLFLPRIRTPRTAKNLANSVRFVTGLLPGEIDPTDQVLLECARILFPHLYRRIQTCEGHRGWSYLERIQLGLGNGDPNQEPPLWEWCKQAWIDEGIEEATESDKRALGFWLPQVNGAIGESGEDVEWWRLKRLCSSAYHWRYFSGAIVMGDISDAEVEELRQICISGSPDAMLRFEASLRGERGIVVGEKLSRSSYSSSEVVQMLKFLSSCKFEDFDSSEYAGRVFDSLDEISKVEEVLIDLANETPVRWFARFIQNVRGKYLNSESQHNGGTPSASLRILADRQLNSLRDEIEGDVQDVVNDIWMIWHFGPFEDLTAVIESKLDQDPRFAFTVLASGCGRGIGVAPPRIWHWNGEESMDSIARVIEIEKIRSALRSFDRGDISRAFSQDSPHKYCSPEELVHEFDATLAAIMNSKEYDGTGGQTSA